MYEYSARGDLATSYDEASSEHNKADVPDSLYGSFEYSSIASCETKANYLRAIA